MGAAPQPPRRLGRAVSLGLAAALVAFAFSPGAVLAAGTLTVTQTSATDCAANHFVWNFSVSNLQPGEVLLVDATFGAVDSYFQTFPVGGAGGSTSEDHAFGGTTSDTLTWTAYDGNWSFVASGTATPNCAPAAPTAKSDCDGTGWTAFPAFKNRGQCVAFVSTSK